MSQCGRIVTILERGQISHVYTLDRPRPPVLLQGHGQQKAAKVAATFKCIRMAQQASSIKVLSRGHCSGRMSELSGKNASGAHAPARAPRVSPLLPLPGVPLRLQAARRRETAVHADQFRPFGICLNVPSSTDLRRRSTVNVSSSQSPLPMLLIARPLLQSARQGKAQRSDVASTRQVNDHDLRFHASSRRPL